MIKYPEVKRGDTVDTYNNNKDIADPYRWLEDQNSEETAEFVLEQNKITYEFLETCGSRDEIKEKLTERYNYEKYGTPFKAGDKYYYFKNTGLQNQSALYQQESLEGESNLFLDPNTWTDDGTASLSVFKFSEDGKYFAYGVSKNGSDWKTIYVKDVENGTVYDDKLEWVKFSGIAWSHDNKGFYYCRFDAPEALKDNANEEDIGKEGDSNKFQKVYYHYVGTSQEEDIKVFENLDDPNWMYGVSVSTDGKYFVMNVSNSCDPVNALYIFDITQSPHEDLEPLCKFGETFDAEYSYIANEENSFIFYTNRSAPKYRLISIDVNNFTEEDCENENWTVVIPEHESNVLQGAKCVNTNNLVTFYLEDAKEILKIYNLNGEYVKDIELPTAGSVSSLTGKKDDTIIFYKFTSFTYPGTIFTYDFETQTSTVFRETQINDFNSNDYITEQVFYNSKDGTKIPMFIVYPSDLEKNESNLTYLYGYGGFNISLTPSFSSFRCSFIQGFHGVLAIPNIRGGGEYGEEWHQGGTKANKQNVFDDFIGAAEYLCEEKYTQPKKIAICGGSNGGLLVAACMLQRPDLFGVVVPMVGVLDMLRFHKFTIGHYWCSDYGCSDNNEDFEYLIKYSPLHNVKKSEEYPACLVTCGDHDDRVIPGHSFKFISELQYQLGGEDYQKNPLLIRIETKAGHGAGKPTSKYIEEVTDIYAFIGKITNTPWN